MRREEARCGVRVTLELPSRRSDGVIVAVDADHVVVRWTDDGTEGLLYWDARTLADARRLRVIPAGRKAEGA